MAKKEEVFRLAKKVWDRVFGTTYRVESMDFYRKREGIVYEVQHKGNDSWSCSCKSWIFKSGVQTVENIETKKRYERCCKHIRFCMQKEGIKFRRVY